MPLVVGGRCRLVIVVFLCALILRNQFLLQQSKKSISRVAYTSDNNNNAKIPLFSSIRKHPSFVDFFLFRSDDETKRTNTTTINITSTAVANNETVTTTSRNNNINITVQDAKHMSSIDYYGVSGAGHRLQRTALVHYASQQAGFALRVFWGICNSVEVYDSLFGPQPLQELVHVQHQHYRLKIANNVPKFGLHPRPDTAKNCLTIHADFAKHNVRYYKGLRFRFRLRNVVEEFQELHFTSADLVIGMHIRAGNGETGDFTQKSRQIDNLDAWLQSLVDRILEQQEEWFPQDKNRRKVVLFLATDTHAVLVKLKELLQGSNITLVHQSQDWRDDGSGISYDTGNENCLGGWESAFVDIMLLSHADVLISPRYSSFTITLPMQLVLASQEKRRIQRPYCELDRNAVNMRCYQDFADWCANGTTRVRGDWMYVPPKRINLTDWGPMELRQDAGDDAYAYNWTERLMGLG